MKQLFLILALPSFMYCAAIPELTQLSLNEKIGQLFVVATTADPENPVTQDILFHRAQRDIPSVKSEEELKKLIKEYAIGGVIFLGKSNAEKQIAMTTRLNELNDTTNKIPLVFALDAEWGPAMRIDNAVKFPFNITLGALQDKQLIQQFGQANARMLKHLGVGICLGPVGDCNTNPENPVINRRSFGESPEQVAICTCACAAGIEQEGVVACAKHAPGHGDTKVDSHTGLPIMTHTKERLNSREMVPFKAAIAQGIHAIMPAHLLIPALDEHNPATLSKKIITDLMRTECGFDVLIITDALDMQALTDHYKPEETPLAAFKAGCDILLCPIDVPAAVARIQQALADKEITEQELDEHVQRILTVKKFIAKHALKTLPKPENISAVLNDEALKNLSKTLFQKAMTLVKNNHLLPLAPQTPIKLVLLGTSTETPFEISLKQQHPCQVWRYAHNAPANAHAELLQAVSADDTVVIGVYGLTYGKPPYGLSEKTLNYIQRILQQHKNVAVVLFGNPYALTLFHESPALVEAYEDHPYAQEAAAHVISGSLKPEGTLPVSASEQIPIRTGLTFTE